MLANLARAFYLLLGLGFIYAGIASAQKLWLVAAPDTQFIKTTGAIEEVIKHANPDHNDGSSAGPFLAEVRFAYAIGGARFVSNTLSANCTWCSPADVLRATGQRPGKLAVGTPVHVFVKRDSPAVAYIALSSKSDVWNQLWFTLLWLVVGPLFIYWHCGVMLGPKEDGDLDG